MYKNKIACLFFLSFTFGLPAQAQIETLPNAAPTSRPPHDAAMLAAIRQAQGSLDKFLGTAAKPPKGSQNYMVKIELPQGDRIRRIWVTEVATTPTGLKGVAFASIDDPEQELLPSQPLDFKRNEVVDWMYTSAKGRQVGGFTICAALAKQPPAARREQLQLYRLDCK